MTEPNNGGQTASMPENGISERLKIGNERVVLLPDNGRFKIERQVRCEGGVEHFWDEAALDYVSAPGHWETVETLARGLATREDARLFMVERETPNSPDREV